MRRLGQNASESSLGMYSEQILPSIGKAVVAPFHEYLDTNKTENAAARCVRITVSSKERFALETYFAIVSNQLHMTINYSWRTQKESDEKGGYKMVPSRGHTKFKHFATIHTAENAKYDGGKAGLGASKQRWIRLELLYTCTASIGACMRRPSDRALYVTCPGA